MGDGTETVGDVKLAISEAENLPFADLVLYYQGSPLNDEACLGGCADLSTLAVELSMLGERSMALLHVLEKSRVRPQRLTSRKRKRRGLAVPNVDVSTTGALLMWLQHLDARRDLM